MKLPFKQIWEGWRNELFPPEAIKTLIHETAQDRQALCLLCEMNSTKGSMGVFSRCLSCGCQLMAKTACLSCSCPLEKWAALITEEEDRDLEKHLK